jgi:hypothetical protein
VCAGDAALRGGWEMAHGLIIVSRDRPELFRTLVASSSQTGVVEVLFDRRQGSPGSTTRDHPDRRAHPDRDTRLRELGFIVIPQPDTARASR